MVILPTHRMEIVDLIREPNPIGLVKVKNLVEAALLEKDLDMEQSVLFKFLKTAYFECFEIAKDEKF